MPISDFLGYEDPECESLSNNREQCMEQFDVLFKGGEESQCIYQPEVHCKGEWRTPEKVVDGDGKDVDNTCGAFRRGLQMQKYVEISSQKLTAIQNVWDQDEYISVVGQVCGKVDMGWLAFTDLDESASGVVATDNMNLETKVLTGPVPTGYWKNATPKTGDNKFIACDVNCEEDTSITDCEDHSGTDSRWRERNKMQRIYMTNCILADGTEKKVIDDDAWCGQCMKDGGDITAAQPDETYCEIAGGTWIQGELQDPPEEVIDEDEDAEMDWNMYDYDFEKAWYASKNNCSGNETHYKVITRGAQGADGTKCPTFTKEESRRNVEKIYHNYEKFVKGGSCNLAKFQCIGGSSCIVDTNKIEALVNRINQVPKNWVDVRVGDTGNWTLPDDDTLKLEIDGTTYSHENKITNEIVYRLARTVCDRYGDNSLFSRPDKTLCSTDKDVRYQPANPGVQPCAYGDGDWNKCYRYDNDGVKDNGVLGASAGPDSLWVRDGIQIQYRTIVNTSISGGTNHQYRWDTKNIKPYELCKWIDTGDFPKTNENLEVVF